MNGTTVAHSTGVRTIALAALSLLCLFIQGNRGLWFWIGACAFILWMLIGVLILMGEVIAEKRDRVTRTGANGVNTKTD